MLKVRFAPSPTGYLHIGGARTCLFNWLYARHFGGTFVLRIEDTDLERSKKEYLEEILESIRWLGMDWDEIYFQSQRFDIYKQYAQKLIDSKRAYVKDGATFFKYEISRIEIDDMIRGKIIFTELPKEEEVIIKSDGSPTYNFCCVIDDALMEMSVIVRGEDHIPNTPKQLLMYEALGFKTPRFAHVPLIMSEEGGRMSKRHGATSIREYKDLGYLPQAIINYLLLLGWSPGDNKEILSLKEACGLFDLKDVNDTASAFSFTKLDWINAEYIKKLDTASWETLVEEYLRKKDFLPPNTESQYLKKVAVLFRERIAKLSDFLDRSRFCFYDDYEYGEDTVDILKTGLAKEISVLQDRLSHLENFSKITIENEFRATAQSLGLKAKDLVHPTRVALTGKKVGPGLFETMEVLGKEKVVARLGRLIDYWEKAKTL